MKKLLLYFSTCLLSLNGYGQECVIANERMNIIYVGLSNSLKVGVDGGKCNRYKITTDNGTIKTTDEQCSHVIIPSHAGVARISVVSKKTKKTIATTNFRVREIPEPVALIDGKSGGDIAKNVLAVQVGLSAAILDMDINAPITVTSFNMTVFRNNKVWVSVVCNEARFNAEAKKAINGIEHGDIVLFSSISYKGVAKSGFISPIEFKITE